MELLVFEKFLNNLYIAYHEWADVGKASGISVDTVGKDVHLVGHRHNHSSPKTHTTRLRNPLTKAVWHSMPPY